MLEAVSVEMSQAVWLSRSLWPRGEQQTRKQFNYRDLGRALGRECQFFWRVGIRQISVIGGWEQMEKTKIN